MEKNINRESSNSKKISLVLLVIIAMLLVAIGVGASYFFKSKPEGNNTNTTNTTNNAAQSSATVVDETQIYEEIINEYKHIIETCTLDDVWKMADKYPMVNSQEIMYKLLNNGNNAQIGYTFYDIDKNGTKEMISGVYFEDSNNFVQCAIYGYNPNTKVPEKIYYLDTVERGSMCIYDNGIIYTNGAASAFMHIYTLGKISKSGYTYESIEEIEETYIEESATTIYKEFGTEKELKYKSVDDVKDAYGISSNPVVFDKIETIAIK